MLASMGYLGAKLFPAQEQVMSFETFSNDLNPWYFAYQPVSYRLQGRMGSRDDLRSAIYNCRKLGVRMYADAVINHFSGGGNDVNPNHRNPNANCATWGTKNSSLNINNQGTAPSSSGPSPYYTQSFVYTEGSYSGKPPSQEYPAADLGPTDFHCERPLNSWNDPLQLNAGWLSGLTDVNTEKDNVRERIADYLTDLISIGFSGFRIDAAKHISPDNLVAILTKFRNNVGGTLPDDFITWLEILLGGEGDLLMCNGDSG
jgi:alpha-amylase